jgi:choline dehydrogenase-like flavoprotein
MSEHFEVVVVGSGAGGGVVAGKLADAGCKVLLLEFGPHLTAADFTRWEAKAAHDMWWPTRFAPINGGPAAVALIAGRCVGGTTTINTKVALRAHENDHAKWREASGLDVDLTPNYESVEGRLGVRERTDWRKSVYTMQKGFDAMGSRLEPVMSYTDANCMSCGSCLQGCPTNAGKSTMNTYIHDAWAAGRLELRAECRVERVVIEDGEARGVEYADAAGMQVRVDADAVVVAAGTLNTPQLLRRSGLTSPLIGRNLGFHPARLMFGLFDEPQDAHMVYPITAHAMEHQHDEDGGFVVEATTLMDPMDFATTVEDEDGPLWGDRLVDHMRKFRYWNGVLVMVNDDNHGAVIDDEVFVAEFDEAEQERIKGAFDFTREVLRAAGASTIRWTGLFGTHVQGTCRMGVDAERSVVDENAQTWEARRLFVGDGSLIPRTLSVNPSLTIMALADRLADHLSAAR